MAYIFLNDTSPEAREDEGNSFYCHWSGPETASRIQG